MKKIDWTKVPANTLVYVWDEDKRPKFPIVRWFVRFDPDDDYPFVAGGEKYTHSDGYKHADLVLPADIEKYSFEEKEPAYRPCKNLKEFKPFFGEIVKRKAEEAYRIISYIDFAEGESVFGNVWWFENCELLEPVNGSTVIGVREN